MKRFWTALAVVVTTILAAASCNDYGNTFQGNTGAVIRFLSPSNVPAGSADFTVTLSGGGFVAKTVVQWNGKNLVTTFGDSTTVSAVVPAALVSKTGSAAVNTLNPHTQKQDNGLSNTVTFKITSLGNPVPTLASVTPINAVAGSADLVLTIAGSDFLPSSDPSGGSKVRWNAAVQTELQTTAITATSITATVPAALLATAGTAVVTVFNPPAPAGSGNPGGGGTSPNGQTFTICATTCPAPGQNQTKTVQALEEAPAVSADGRYVAFTAVEGGHAQIFLRDSCEGAATGCASKTTLVSVNLENLAANDDSHQPSMSRDGRFVAFSSRASNLVSEAPKGRQIYVRDTCIAAEGSCQPSTKIISTDEAGALVGLESILPSVSASGRYVAFVAVTPSHAAGQPASKTANSGLRQVFVRDTCAGAADCTPKTTRISTAPGDTAPGGAEPAGPAISGEGKHVAATGDGVATLFTHSVAVDDRVFLARTENPR